MIKTLVCGLLCMGSALSSQAAVQGYDWTFSGFRDHWSSETNPWGEYGEFDPDAQLKGRFYAEDLDNDGSFSRSEVSSFTIYDQSFLNGRCPGFQDCGLRDFAFTPGGALTFDAVAFSEYGQWGSGWSRTTKYYRASTNWEYSYVGTAYENDWSGSGASAYNSLFTAETKFAISPVPEPQTWLMLGAGLVLLGAAKRGRLGGRLFSGR